MAKHKGTGCYVAIKRLKKVEVLRLKQVEHVLSEKQILLQGNDRLCSSLTIY
jgi:protein kinase X